MRWLVSMNENWIGDRRGTPDIVKFVNTLQGEEFQFHSSPVSEAFRRVVVASVRFGSGTL